MKIAYFTNKYPYVRHTFIRREIEGVEKHGIEVERFSIRRADDLIDPADIAEQKRTHTLHDKGLLGLGLGMVIGAARRPLRFFKAWWCATRMGLRSYQGVLRHWGYLAEACLLVRRMKALEVRHLHVHFGTNCAAVALFCRMLADVPYSLTIHGSEEWDRPEALSLKEKYENAEFVTAVSDFGRCQVLRWTDRTYWPRVHVVHCGVDRLFLDGDMHPLPAEPRLVVVAALVAGKGHVRLLEALSVLAAEKRDFELLLIGDGPLRQELILEVVTRGLDKHVKFLGWRNSEVVREQILNSRLMVLPSFAENLPVVFMESLALGRPVIAPHIAGIPELIETGVNGWLVAPGSVEGLANALREALDMPMPQMTAMGRAGRATVAEFFDSLHEAGKMVELFRALPTAST